MTIIENEYLAVLGECMIELSKNDYGLVQGFAGDTYNTAVYLSRLSKFYKTDLNIEYITALGKDPLSQDMVENFCQEGLRTQAVKIDDHQLPGIYYIDKDGSGERSFFFWRTNSAAKNIYQNRWRDDINAFVKNSKVLFFSLISLAIMPDKDRRAFLALLDRLKPKTKIIFDNNYRAALWSSPTAAAEVAAEAMNLADCALLSFEDDQAMFESKSPEFVIERIRDTNASADIIVKDGGNTCFYSREGSEIKAVALDIVADVVDTTAAGDSFNAGFIHEYLHQGSIKASVMAGHKLAKFVIQHHGAIADLDAMTQYLERRT